MKRGGIYILLISLALMGVAIAGCGSPDQPDFESTLAITNASGVSKATFNEGEGIRLKLTVTSVTGEPITVEIPSHTYEFLIFNEDASTVLWHASHHMGPIPAAVSYLEFAPDQSMIFNTTWDQTDDFGLRVGIGNYLAQGYLATTDEALNTTFSPTETRSELMGFSIVNTP